MTLFTAVSETIGLPEDQIRMVFGFLISIPFGLIFQNIKGRQARNYSGIIAGLLLTYMVYDLKMISVVVQSVIVYVMVSSLGKKSPIPVFLETLAFVSAHHLYRQYTDYGGWKLDISTILMMDTCKWTSFAWCVADGLKAEDKLSQDQKQRKISKLPSFLDYFGYIFFYAGCLAGPAYDYYEWDQFMDLSNNYNELVTNKAKLSKPIVIETLKRLRNGAITSILMILGGIYFPLDYMLTEEFASMNFLLKTVWMNVSITLMRTKYLSGWSFSEASIASSGFTFDGYDKEGNAKFQRIKSVDIDLDLTYNIQEKQKMWNISVQRWLAKYVYFRVYDEAALKGSTAKQNKAQLITYLVSAFWHGFYPGYYTAFVQWAYMAMGAKFFYKASINTKRFVLFETNVVLQFLRYYWVNTIFNMIGCGFVFLSLESNLIFFNAIYWIQALIVFSVYGFFTLTGYGQRSEKKKE